MTPEPRPVTPSPDLAPTPDRSTTLTIGGMTCAACVGRVEKKLGRLDGVAASVNLATGRATVSHPAAVSVTELISTVEAAGFTARLREPAPEAGTENRPSPADRADARNHETVETQNSQGSSDSPDSHDDGARAERHRLLVTALLSLPVLVLSMVPVWQFRNWQWLCFVLAAPVALWGAAPSTPVRCAGCGTARRPWTPWSPSASPPPSAGPPMRCSSAGPGRPV